MSEQHTLFQLSGQSLVYGDHRVLDNISLQIKAGEKVALVGPSGAGKTTLLHLLFQQRPEQTALQPQSGGLVDLLSVYQNIFIGALERVGTLPALWNLVRPLAAHRKAVAELVQTLGLEEKLWQSVDRLSGGQRQRVAIGRALYRQQPVFLGDEPVSSLDPLQARLLLEHLLHQHETAVVSLHNRQLALNHFDRIIVMRDGRICCDCPAGELSEEGLDAYYQQEPSPHPEPPPEDLQGWAMVKS
ncbi:phosphonates import ATP-binding protein PhnC 1 [Marinobacterium zhoushanense]|uniref:Phosphonates import ATP-binding protein PhnC 1 n=1 Tax=Marinobacterium zhoushanense TaxID=1679163 RepID=A0ABQ1KDS7_9GAMM|nr:ATP-binding cassette domain-containing protein [Marinobacterium zhoushanense]GGB93501.1 phosphonates import ATP-binding protein PhnC 1 [Marinobacterium zhoushanense]